MRIVKPAIESDTEKTGKTAQAEVKAIIEQAKKEHARTLDLGGLSLTEIPKEVFEMEWLTELILSSVWYEHNPQTDTWEEKHSSNQLGNNRISSLPIEIKGLELLEKLVISGIGENLSLKPLSSTYLTTLYATSNGINTVEDIAHMPLRVLDLSDNIIEEIEPFRNMGLQKLGLRRNNVKSLHPLLNMSTLSHLRCV